MREYLTKTCMFLFLAAALSGRTNELGVVTGALTGTILLWPLYRKLVPVTKRRGYSSWMRSPRQPNGLSTS